jgi:hypothetical protein
MPFLIADGHFLRLADAEADDPVAVAHHHQRAEAQVLAALDDLGDAVDRTTVSLMSSCDGSIFSRMRCMPLELQSGFRAASATA